MVQQSRAFTVERDETQEENKSVVWLYLWTWSSISYASSYDINPELYQEIQSPSMMQFCPHLITSPDHSPVRKLDGGAFQP